MGKAKQLFITIAGCLALGTVLGVAFWLFDGGKTCKKVSNCPGGLPIAQEMAFKNEWERESKIREIKDCLESYQKGLIVISRQGVWELKDELCKLTGTEKPIKIYAGKWHKDYLEVLK